MVLSSFLFSCQRETTPPNIVFVLIDDLGWNDLGCYGSTFYETPAIDQLAQSGMRFTDAYASCPVCSPTRASILTGKSPARLNITDWIPGADPKNRKLLGTEDQHALPLGEYTFAERLQEEGYQTAFFGKWHLGDQGFLPEDQGFAINKGGHDAGQPATYFYPYQKGRKTDVPGLEGGQDGEYLTDRLTNESLQFIEANKDQPFLLYLAHYAVHTPIESKDSLTQKYIQKLAAQDSTEGPDFVKDWASWARQRQDNPAYAGMVESVDESLARILEKLAALDLTEETVIIFTSDNGGLSTLYSKRGPTSVTPLRTGKGWLYEGGIRVPLIISWPGKITPGLTTSQLANSTDFYPTLLDLLGLEQMPDQHVDGLSLAPVLTQKTEQEERSLFWHFPHYHGSGNMPSAAIRMGNYKLIQWFEQDSLELFDLQNDLSEQVNLADSLPEKTEELRQQLKQWQAESEARFPKKNPAFGKAQ